MNIAFKTPGLSTTSLGAVSKLLSSPECAEDVVSVMRAVIAQFTTKELEIESVEVPVPVKLWQVNGCHELLASLGKSDICIICDSNYHLIF